MTLFMNEHDDTRMNGIGSITADGNDLMPDLKINEKIKWTVDSSNRN